MLKKLKQETKQTRFKLAFWTYKDRLIHNQAFYNSCEFRHLKKLDYS